jgi:hypothetical protein
MRTNPKVKPAALPLSSSPKFSELPYCIKHTIWGLVILRPRVEVVAVLEEIIRDATSKHCITLSIASCKFSFVVE